jgi:hypothetical protein
MRNTTFSDGYNNIIAQFYLFVKHYIRFKKPIVASGNKLHVLMLMFLLCCCYAEGINKIVEDFPCTQLEAYVKEWYAALLVLSLEYL